MTDKLKRLIGRIKRRIFYSRCYNKMEGLGIAVFCMCSGALVPEYFVEKCLHCPYFTKIPHQRESRRKVKGA
jgi:hypothetical protein